MITLGIIRRNRVKISCCNILVQTSFSNDHILTIAAGNVIGKMVMKLWVLYHVIFTKCQSSF